MKSKLATTLSIFTLLCLSIGFLLRITGYPNQLIFFISGILVGILILIPSRTVLLFREIKSVRERLLVVGSAGSWAVLFILAPVVRMEASTPFLISSVALLLVVTAALVRFRHQRLAVYDQLLLVAVLLCFFNAPFKGQAPDKTFDPEITSPTYEASSGPTVYLDEAHHNFHKLNGLYWAFGEVLRADGYITKPITGPFSAQSLQDKEIIAIANALNEKNETNWVVPTYSAFTEEEQAALEKWVKNGGSLFLIADHMPIAGAAADLARRFGVDFINGYAMDTLGRDDWFVRADQTLKSNPITDGFKAGERVDSILTFTGQAFKIPANAQPILTFGKDYMQWEPDTAWNFNDIKPYSIEGYAQGIYMQYGEGKIVAFGEAMMFTSQLGWGLSWRNLGLSNPKVKDNQQLLLNIIHWLDDEYQQQLH